MNDLYVKYLMNAMQNHRNFQLVIIREEFI